MHIVCEGEKERQRKREGAYRIFAERYSRLSIRIGDRCKIIMSAAVPMRDARGIVIEM